MVVSFTADEEERNSEQLITLLVDAVDSGASVGFMPPLSEADALEYWRGVVAAMREGSRVLLVALEGEAIQGSVQLGLEMRANGNHRAEAMKMCESLGYVRYGEVPGYARSGDGRLHTTVFFYRQLE